MSEAQNEQQTEPHVEKTSEQQVVPLTEIEEIASAQGWKPDGARTAVDFLRHVPSYRDNLVGKLSQMERRHNQLVEQLAKMSATDLARERRAAEQDVRRAAESGDGAAAVKAAERMQAVQAAPTPQPDNDAAGWDAWKAANQQIVNDPEMFRDAVAFANAEMANLGRDDASVIGPIVTNKIRKLFSERFTNPNRAQATATTASAPVRQTKSGGYDALPQAEREIYERMRVTDPELTPDRIMKSLDRLKASNPDLFR